MCQNYQAFISHSGAFLDYKVHGHWLAPVLTILIISSFIIRSLTNIENYLFVRDFCDLSQKANYNFR